MRSFRRLFGSDEMGINRTYIAFDTDPSTPPHYLLILTEREMWDVSHIATKFLRMMREVAGDLAFHPPGALTTEFVRFLERERCDFFVETTLGCPTFVASYFVIECVCEKHPGDERASGLQLCVRDAKTGISKPSRPRIWAVEEPEPVPDEARAKDGTSGS